MWRWDYSLSQARRVRPMIDPGAAFDRITALLRTAPNTPGAWSELVLVARASAREDEAIAACIHAVDADPTLHYALRALLHLIPDEPGGEGQAVVAADTARLPTSVVVCSNDDQQFAAMAASYERALAGWPHEIVRIADASSLAEGYTRGIAAASGAVIIFSHDDVELLAADLGARLTRRLAECDVLGVAGATRASGPAWSFAGWPYLHGLVIYPEGNGYKVTVYSRIAPLAHGIRIMDGVFLAMRRETARTVGFDARTCDGFHGYDLDFTLRAAKAGLRLAVATDLGLVHQSYGSFDERWQAAARNLMARHPELNGVPGEMTGFEPRSVPSAKHAMALVDNWARIGRPT